MYIMYLGYLSAFVVVLIGFAFWNLPSHPHPAMGALAFFILLPSMVVAISIEVLVAIPARDKTIVADNFRKRLVGRPRAFLIGFTVGLGGASTVLAVLAVAYSLEFSGFLAIGCFFFRFHYRFSFPCNWRNMAFESMPSIRDCSHKWQGVWDAKTLTNFKVGTVTLPAGGKVVWPSGWGIDGWWKGLFGQKIYRGPTIPPSIL